MSAATALQRLLRQRQATLKRFLPPGLQRLDWDRLGTRPGASSTPGAVIAETMPPVDVCLIIEGGYPYQIGGVASWADALMRASPQLTFHVIAITISSQSHVKRFEPPPNLRGVTDVILDRCPDGRPPSAADAAYIEAAVRYMHRALTSGDATSFCRLSELVRETGLGGGALFDTKVAWTAFERVYADLLPSGSLVDFFWSWRFLARSLLAVVGLDLPKANVFHAVSTGYAGIVGAFAKHSTRLPLILTEHGIYTNERRIELAVATWLFDSNAGGYGCDMDVPELRNVWLQAFQSFSSIAYSLADRITTQYVANQDFQRTDGAPEHKLLIIPNGVDVDHYAAIPRCLEPRPPTVLMIGRIVPIKDTRTFIMAIARLRELVPEVAAICIGPDTEDPDYAAGCHDLIAQLQLGPTLRLISRVPDVAEYLARADVLSMTSISEAQPIALLEAAAMGLPAVTTDVGSCRDIIDGFAGDPVKGRGGFVVDVCDPDGMARALAAILLDRDLRERMGDTLRRRAAGYYGKHRVRRLYEELYSIRVESPIQVVTAME
ncbi:MAG: GT4 family glycosyltransferase PelF [Proteobacteria bacterium]|nr:GT4 family glycosyltransferase PelF [Pseudomonadota bacterium]